MLLSRDYQLRRKRSNRLCKEATKNQMARWGQYCFSGRMISIFREKVTRKIKLKREASCRDRISHVHLLTHSTLLNSQTPMSFITESSNLPPTSSACSCLTGISTVDPTSTKPCSDLIGTAPSESFPKRLYNAWKAGLGPTYGIDTKRGDEFMQIFDAHAHNIKCLGKDVVAGEDEEDRRERNRQRDRLRSAYLKTSPERQSVLVD